MSSLLSRLSGTPKSAKIEPREIFMALPKRVKGYEYPRDVQSEVWKKWFDIRNYKNCVIKMNTGSGKTVVGLMILQSCLNEEKGPAIYLVPNKYLINQVCEEAGKLGIQVVTDKDDYKYTNKEAILVTTIHTVINGRTAFGINKNYPIGSVLIDDVHACLDTIVEQFSVKIPYNHKAYSEIIKLFSEQWKGYNNKTFIDIIENKNPTQQFIVPFWYWQEKTNEIYRILSKYNNSEDANHCIFFKLPLIEDFLVTCDCIITAREIEIIPEGVNISKIKSFENAQRRIFMSATLSDDSVFVSSIGLNEDDISNIITPESANDIGDRLILFPKHLNNKIKDDDIREKIIILSKEYNTTVIVPSFDRAKYWDPTGLRTINSENIHSFISAMKNGHVGLVVLVNRYDGIDLPDTACELLVIDGLPPLNSEKDKYIHSIDPSCSILKRQQIQRIEQGMGRGVRSNNDSCCIVLMGDELSDVLLRQNGVSFFSSATKEQYYLSKDLWDLLREDVSIPTVDDIFDLAEYSLNRVDEWIQKSKERLSSIKYSNTPQFDNNAIALREAYNFSMILQYQRAIEALDKAINSEHEKTTKGFLMQVKAKYFNLIDQSQAQQVLLSAKSYNLCVISPINGIRYEKRISNTTQSKSIIGYIANSRLDQNNYLILVDSIISNLVFSSISDTFEKALQNIGEIIGFISTRPDKETNGQGPDNLWSIGNNSYLVIECKNESCSTTISKDYCNQLSGSMRWFSQVYGDLFNATPIMVHNSKVIDIQATAEKKMRIITPEKLEELKTSVKQFADAIVQDTNWQDETKITRLLKYYKLDYTSIITNYSVEVEYMVKKVVYQ